MGGRQSSGPNPPAGGVVRRDSNGTTASRAALVASGGHAYVDRHPACRFCVYVRIVVGTITAGVMFWAGIVTLLDYGQLPVALFLMFFGVPVVLLELGGFVRLCCGRDGACCRFFGLFLGLDAWRRAVFYALLGAVCWMPDVRALPAKIAGGCLLATALLYLAKSFQKKKVKTFMLEPQQQQQQQQTSGQQQQRNEQQEAQQPVQQTPQPKTVNYSSTAPTVAPI